MFRLVEEYCPKMNPLISIVFALVLAAVSGQESPPPGGNCCASQQPVVIQLSCNGNNGPSRHPPPPPRPYDPMPPMPMPYPPQSPVTPFGMSGYDEHSCDFDEGGYPTGNPPGGFPEGYHLVLNEFGEPAPKVDGNPFYPLPPHGWDLRPETLGFPMPPPGTAHYNAIMCTPIAVPVMSPGRK